MREVAQGIWCIEGTACNAYIVETGPNTCVIVDTGLAGWDRLIGRALRRIRGGECVPTAIVLTHGHFDRVGAAHALAHNFGVPIYAHARELPYLEGRAEYPPADPTVGGMHGFVSRFTGRRRLKLGPHLQAIPAAEDAWEGGFPEVMPGWRWILTPGHTPGHIALYRAEDGVLLAGDACSTVNMDSWLDKALNRSQLWRAGTPYVYDWNQAKESVRLLARLQPRVLACGYGRPMSDPHVARRLGAFAESFPVPCHGRYVETPAEVGTNGVTYLPQPALDRLVWFLGGVAIALLRSPSHRLSEPQHTRHNRMSRSDRSLFRATRASFRA